MRRYRTSSEETPASSASWTIANDRYFLSPRVQKAIARNSGPRRPTSPYRRRRCMRHRASSEAGAAAVIEVVKNETPTGLTMLALH